MPRWEPGLKVEKDILVERHKAINSVEGLLIFLGVFTQDNVSTQVLDTFTYNCYYLSIIYYTDNKLASLEATLVRNPKL